MQGTRTETCSFTSFIRRILASTGRILPAVRNFVQYYIEILKEQWQISEEFNRTDDEFQASISMYDRSAMARGGVLNGNGVVVFPNNVVRGDVCAVNAGQKAERKQCTQFPREILEARHKMIKAGIRYDMNRALVISSAYSQMRPDMIMTVCSTFDSQVEIRDSWILDEVSHQRIWGGAMAIFTMEIYAQLASNTFKQYYTDVCPMPFGLLVDLYIAAEIRYPTFGIPATCIQISGGKSFHPHNTFDLEMELHKFGIVEEIHYRNDVKEYGIICEVDYKYVAHAFAAMTAIDGMYFYPEGYLSVKLVDTIKVKQINEHCENYVSQWLKATQIQ